MNDKQRAALRSLCERYKSTFDESKFHPQFDLPTGYVAGWVGCSVHGKPGSIYVGCAPDGSISS